MKGLANFLAKYPWVFQFTLSSIIAAFTAIIFCLSCYTHYIEKNMLTFHSVDNIKQEVETINTKLTKQNVRLSFLSSKETELFSYNHANDVRISSISNNFLSIKDYQQILRKEVKAIAEGKLNTEDFWRIENSVLIRIRWLEDQHHIMEK